MKVNIDKKKKLILFICTPSLVILDSWLFTLEKLRKRLPTWQFIFIMTRPKTVKEIDTNSFLIKTSGKIFDLIIFKSYSNLWVCTKTFEEAKIVNVDSYNIFFDFLIRFFNKLNLKKVSSLFNKFYRLFSSKKYFDFLFDINKILQTNYITLFDIYELDKEYNKNFYKIITKSFNFSIKHGTIPEVLKKNKKQKKLLNTSKSFVYALSKIEIDYYKNIYGLDDTQIKVSGNPKHDKNWINHILKIESHHKKKKKYIFVIARPESTYLTINKKKSFLKMIKSVAIEHNLKVILKLHPKEVNDQIYREIFVTSDRNISWEISNKHPYVLGKYCEFAVSFYSGVSIDLIKVGTPSIELLDLKGISEYDNQDSLRDEKQEPVLNVRYLDLVLGASNEKEFKNCVGQILNDKKKILKNLQSQYIKVFSNHQKTNKIIVKDIITKTKSVLKDKCK